jgi:hypothetical protein
MKDVIYLEDIADIKCHECKKDGSQEHHDHAFFILQNVCHEDAGFEVKLTKKGIVHVLCGECYVIIQSFAVAARPVAIN